ncbi:MAG TPA: hypothetical protein VFN97_28570 [Actinospica sp.]|nr:hypothetical protein [Actinospica sp.]
MKKRTPATAAVAASIAAALYLTTTSPNQPSSMLTASEANQLAQARYADYRNGVTALTATIPVSGQPFRLSGRVDWHIHLGYATLTAPADEGSGSSELLQWSPNGLAVRGNWKAPYPPR